MSIRAALLGWQQFSVQIFYFFPDAPNVRNPNWLLWTADDRAPDFPRLNAYLKWWNANLDGKIAHVRVGVVGLLSPTDLNLVNGEFRLN